MSITISSRGREQQINTFPCAGGPSGSGSYFTDPDINPHSQVWQTPARQDQRTGTSQASASSSRLWKFESQETVSPARANETLGLHRTNRYADAVDSASTTRPPPPPTRPAPPVTEC